MCMYMYIYIRSPPDALSWRDRAVLWPPQESYDGEMVRNGEEVIYRYS